MTLTPVLSVGTDTYTTVQTVSISDSTSGATIYYTTDGTTPTASSTRYGGPITVSSSEIIQAIAIATGYAPSAVATATYTINLPPAPTPTYSPLAGTYTSSQTVSISDSSPGAAIYYTTNGSPPTTSATKYAGPILVSSTETIQAIAVATGYSQSAIASAAFTINLPPTSTPVFSPVAGTYTAIQNVSISDSTSGAKIYYTTDGSTPSITSTMYSGAINISATETVQAIAVASGYSQSALATAAYTINIPQVATPTFSPAGGTYTSVQTVTIAVTTSGASIYYTTDGTAPTTNSTKYTSAIAVGTTETIQAIAVATGYKQSALASSTYTINIPQVATPLFSIGGGTYSSIQTVTISDSTSGAMIYYTTNGIAPTTSSTKYTGAITVSASETIQAIAVATGFTQSITASATYTINLPQTATPTLSVPAGTYTSAQLVTLSDSTAGATIYYTTNGTTPTIASTKYTTGINVSTTETVEAIALATGYTQSAVASAMYTLAIPMATLTLSASPNPQGVGEAVVITANVTVVNSSASTAGTFTVTSNGGTICGPAITNTPTGFTCSVTNLAQGTHSISATYVGTYNGGLQANAGPISVSILPVAVTPGWISTCSGNLCSIFSWEYVGVPGEYVGWALGQGAVPNCSAGPSAPNPSNFAKGSILNVIGCASGYEPSPVYSAPVQ
jgi:ribosome-binding factor A